ncbi:MAG: hypothetical protein RBT16_05480, partial [Desulfococcus multivorans]|nr:hypothetical protein [Desulfococcus multivorans]
YPDARLFQCGFLTRRRLDRIGGTAYGDPPKRHQHCHPEAFGNAGQEKGKEGQEAFAGITPEKSDR